MDQDAWQQAAGRIKWAISGKRGVPELVLRIAGVTLLEPRMADDPDGVNHTRRENVAGRRSFWAHALNPKKNGVTLKFW